MGYKENGVWHSFFGGSEIDYRLMNAQAQLLDNAYFMGGGSQQGGEQFPINQNGLTTYTKTSGAICIDRWKQYKGTIALSNEGLSLSSTSTGVAARQTLKKSVISNYKTTVPSLPRLLYLTAYGYASKENSWYVALDNNGTLSNKVYFPKDIPLANNPKYRYPNGSVVISNNNASVVIGTDDASATATLNGILFQPNCAPVPGYYDQATVGYTWVRMPMPDYHTELEKCQRYYLPITAGTITKGLSIGNTLYFDIETPITMVGTPKLTADLSIVALDGSAHSLTVTAGTTGSVHPAAVQLTVSAPTLTALASVSAQVQNSTFLSAE